ncbi:unnamed protein product [Rotaria sp. Silwood2]|nr:unnamed protein product [Rotaria sp. Silwood2]CAF4135700.1 unnamed protein product [Rotaria sp. Silwood2]
MSEPIIDVQVNEPKSGDSKSEEDNLKNSTVSSSSRISSTSVGDDSMDSSDDGMDSSDDSMDSSDDEIEDQIIYDEGIFSDPLTKLRTLMERAQSDGTSIKSTLLQYQRIILELVNITETNKSVNITVDNVLAVKKSLRLFVSSIDMHKFVRFAKGDPIDGREVLYGERHSPATRTINKKIYAVRPLISIIHNISRHDDGISRLNSFDALNLIKKFKNDIFDTYSSLKDEIIILSSMTLALLSTPEEIKKDRKRMNDILDQLLQIIIDTSQSKEYKAGGFHISEPLIVLVRLICYDRTLDYILNHAQVDLDEEEEDEPIVKFFIDLFLKYKSNVKDDNTMKVSTCTALMNILWSVSLRPQYKEELRSNQKLTKLIEQIANDKQDDQSSTCYVPRYIENIQKAAQGILCNIADLPKDNEKLERQDTLGLRALVLNMMAESTDSSTETKPKKPSIMISYSHVDNVVCTQLYDELSKRDEEFDIWIDRKYCKTGYLWGKIADGITDANVVLCILSQKYYESKSCQQEFVYAHDHLKKQVIPVFIEQEKPPGWIAIHTCVLKYIRFRQTQPLDRAKLSELMEMIEEYLSLNNKKDDEKEKNVMARPCPTHYEHPSSTTSSTSNVRKKNSKSAATTKSPINLSEKPTEAWQSEDVAQWFQENKIFPTLWTLYEFVNGSELLNYYHNISTDEKSNKQYETYAKAYSQETNGKILELLNVTDAFDTDNWNLALASRNFVLYHASYTTDDQTIIDTFKKKVLFAADNIYKASSKICAVRGATRDFMQWAPFFN